jgi:hypothetical protein
MAGTVSENAIFKVLIVALIFLVVNFDPDMAFVFSLMIIADFLIFKDDRIVSYPFERTTSNRFISLLETLIVFAGFIFLQTIILRLLTPSIQTTAQSIKTLLSLYATTTPALQGNIILTIIAFGIIVPFVETRFFFARLYEIMADRFKVGGGLRNRFNWIIAIFIGVIFAIYHLTARRCGSATTCQNALLFVTFIFGTLSTLMVIHYKENKQAVFLHVFANLIAVLFSLGLLSFIGLGG